MITGVTWWLSKPSCRQIERLSKRICTNRINNLYPWSYLVFQLQHTASYWQQILLYCQPQTRGQMFHHGFNPVLSFFILSCLLGVSVWTTWESCLGNEMQSAGFRVWTGCVGVCLPQIKIIRNLSSFNGIQITPCLNLAD